MCSSFSKMYGVDFLSDGPPTPITENFQMEVQYAYMHKQREKDVNEYFLLDFVEFDQLNAYAADIDAEAKIAADHVSTR